MNIQQKSQQNVWVRSLILTFFVSLALQIIVTLCGTLMINSNSRLPSSFHWVWEIACLVLLTKLTKRLGSSPGTFWVFIFVALWVSALSGFVLPDSLRLLRPRYVGVESRLTLDTHAEGFPAEREEYNFSLVGGFLYRADDPELRRDARDKGKYVEYVGTKGFLF